MSDENPDLESAYALETPADNRRLYAQWAQTYDQAFATDMDYRMPQIIALIFAELEQGCSPVLDAGAGTGLLTQAMPVNAGYQIDALDLSPDMLKVAASKGVYRRTIQADLTARLPVADGTYGGVVSAGTFTHGHVGPDALDELLRVARGGALFVLGINAAHFVSHGFAAKFDNLENRIENFEKRMMPIYGSKAQGDHKDDQAVVVTFTKRPSSGLGRP